ncbi:MAG TPA: pyruvate:ferredoxin (flavodoxin) oxidoreductase [Acidimicrobiia bacterium]|nr:pyruvate:ferredoxin (flavodoxin) oxidoreductase [Acidimicrobiia bacterium]
MTLTEAPTRTMITVDGNEAAASVAYRTNEVLAIYPITPSSPMGELSDEWSNKARPNVWGNVPRVIEMQSEAGAAGTVHGALLGGALTSTFTASQGLLLMIPNMYKIAGELLPAVFHVAARSVATHALSIFGDHSDVMATRATGWSMLASNSVQEAHDLALIAQAATLESRVPFVHFFDGFRTSHEVNMIDELSDDDIRAMVPIELVLAHRNRRLDPDRPELRGTAQNPDVFFQAREACNPFYDAVPDIVQGAMDRFADRVGRRYRLFDYVGAPDATEVIVMMGSGVAAAESAVNAMVGAGEKVGLVKVRLFRPFSPAALAASLPSTVRTIAVLDRTKEPGAVGEPLMQDVMVSLVEETQARRTSWSVAPRIIGGRYGLSSKEFTPAMAAGVFAEARKEEPKRRFTVGIVDDVTHLSIDYDPTFDIGSRAQVRAVFYGLGADGTVGANKNTVKIVGDDTNLYAQGYFVYDSRKSGSMTTSHLRFDPKPIEATYLISDANFVACHHFDFLGHIDVLAKAEHGATFLLNSVYGPDEVWDHLPREVQQQIIDKELKLHVVDATSVAREAGLGQRINTVLQTCFFALTDVLPIDEAIGFIKGAITKSYAKFGDVVVERNNAAVDGAVAGLHRVSVPAVADSQVTVRRTVPEDAPDFVTRVTAMMLEDKGDLLPVSAMPVDGAFPTGTTQYEKRSIAVEIPIFDPEICIECAKCALVCPHAAIRLKVFDASDVVDAPDSFKVRQFRSRDIPDALMTIQVAPDDCTGCSVCVDVCPAKSKSEVKHKAINMRPKQDHLAAERENWDFFLSIPEIDRSLTRPDTVKGVQMLEPLFEFSGACSGCGETPYVKLVSQLVGDRLMVANATGCSSIYGGNLPTTPWRTNAEGRGPAWANSLFEDNAEFGLGMRLALDAEISEARDLVDQLAHDLGEELVRALLDADQSTEAGIADQRRRVALLDDVLETLDSEAALRLKAVSGSLVKKSVWIMGGDGWAYDIGFGGVDHALASGLDINILVMDTEVYSNTGGQASKATPRGAVAKFTAGGKTTGKKDLGQIAMSYGNVYVAQVAIGANNTQAVKAIAEAEAYEGPSIVIAYSTCIAHGMDMATSMSHQKDLVDTGYWPLYRYDPRVAEEGNHPFRLDSRPPSRPFAEIALKEARYAVLSKVNPDGHAELMRQAQQDIDNRWSLYEDLAELDRIQPEHMTDQEVE